MPVEREHEQPIPGAMILILRLQIIISVRQVMLVITRPIHGAFSTCMGMF
jgi:hypothetical protein